MNVQGLVERNDKCYYGPKILMKKHFYLTEKKLHEKCRKA